MIDTILRYLAQPSTWAGAGIIAAAVSQSHTAGGLTPEAWSLIVTGAGAIVLPERGAPAK